MRDLGTLSALRGEVANHSIATTAAINSYSAIMADGVTVAEQGLQDQYVSQSLATTARAEVKLYTAAMLAAEENDIYSAALAQGRMTQANMTELARSFAKAFASSSFRTRCRN